MYLNIFSDILKNMEEDLKSFIKLPLFKKEILNSSDLEILPARDSRVYFLFIILYSFHFLLFLFFNNPCPDKMDQDKMD